MLKRCFRTGYLHNYSSARYYVNVYHDIFFAILNVAYDFTINKFNKLTEYGVMLFVQRIKCLHQSRGERKARKKLLLKCGFHE